MNIGIEAQRLYRRKKHGMEIVALETIKAILANDTTNEYTLIVKEDESPVLFKKVSNFKIHITAGRIFPVWEQFLLPSLVNKSSFDLLHCTSNTAPLNCSKPLVITIHDVIYMNQSDSGGSAYQKFGNLYRRYIVPRVAKKADAIITVSEYAKGEIAGTLGIPLHKIFVVHNGVSSSFRVLNEEDVSDFRNKKNLPEKFLLHFGNTAIRKNTQGVIKAFIRYCESVHNPYPMVITNTDQKEISGMLSAQNSTPFAEKIICLGYLPEEELPLLYNAAHMFVYPSLSEGFGMPVIESMACGTPVITSNVSSLPEVAGEAALLVDPHDIRSITSAMIRLHDNKDLYESLKKSGLKNAEKFTWKKAAEKIISIYKETIMNSKLNR